MALLGKYLSFLWKSTSEHGVHSPFVYNLVTQCFYNSQKIPYKNYPKGISEKKGQFILRLLAYFNPKSIKIYSEQEDFSIFFPKPLTDNIPNGKKDMLFIHHISDFPSPEELTTQMHNDSVLVWVSPHSPENEPTVKKLTENKTFSVIIDTFSFALFFIRKEQSREVFFIRT
nr:hypothetical protein [uncultured Capnocytophaga sp.]